jgi:hypothetical protein
MTVVMFVAGVSFAVLVFGIFARRFIDNEQPFESIAEWKQGYVHSLPAEPCLLVIQKEP